MKKLHIVRETTKHVTMVPEHELSRTRGREVVNLLEIETDMKAMLFAINEEKFPGEHRAGYALAHHQVAREHFRFFVVADKWAKMFGGHKVMLNPKFVSVDREIEEREGCLSHPYRGTRLVKRRNSVFAEWETPEFKKVEMQLEGLAARIFLHEYDHTIGKTIWLKP